MKIAELSVKARHLYQIGVTIALVATSLAIASARLTAVEEGQNKQDLIVEQIRKDVGKIMIEQAVSSERMDTVIKQQEKQGDKLDRILERLSDR